MLSLGFPFLLSDSEGMDVSPRQFVLNQRHRLMKVLAVVVAALVWIAGGALVIVKPELSTTIMWGLVTVFLVYGLSRVLRRPVATPPSVLFRQWRQLSAREFPMHAAAFVCLSAVAALAFAGTLMIVLHAGPSELNKPIARLLVHELIAIDQLQEAANDALASASLADGDRTKLVRSATVFGELDKRWRDLETIVSRAGQGELDVLALLAVQRGAVAAAAERVQQARDTVSLRESARELLRSTVEARPALDRTLATIDLRYATERDRVTTVAIALLGVKVCLLAGLWMFVLQPMLRRTRVQFEQLERLAMVTRSAATGVIVCDVHGRIEWCNEGFARITGFSLEECLGRSPGDLLQGPMTDPETVRLMRERIGNRQPFVVEILNYTKDQTPYWIGIDCRPLWDSEGQHVGFMAIESDIDQRVRLETSLREQQNQLRIALSAVDAGVWSYDIQSGDLAWDERMYRMYEVDPTEPLTLSTWSRCVVGDDLDAVLERLHDAVAHKSEFRAQFRIKKNSGDVRWISADATVIRDQSGKPLRIIGVNIDQTERVQAQTALSDAKEQAEAASRAKTSFLANMSHEIRTPMTAILGYTDLLNEASDQHVRQEYVSTIQRNGEHLLSIINDVLDLSKIEAGRLTVERLPVSIRKSIGEVAALLDVQARGKGIEITTVIDPDVPELVWTDPIRVRQIIMNLVGNAVKFTEVGSVQVHCHAQVHQGRHLLVMEVKDTGLGMTREQIARLFTPFTQATSEMSRRFGGTGLGLSISKRLAHLLGGDIAVSSEPGRGSNFAVSIEAAPCQTMHEETPSGAVTQSSKADDSGSPTHQESQSPAPAPAPAPASASAPANGAPVLPILPGDVMRGRKVLLVEDGPDNQRLISHHLRKAGADVVVAGNGRLGVEELCDGLEGPPKSDVEFSVILMDMQMPEMDGYTATRLLRARGLRTPIVAITAHAMAGDREACLLAGCDDYMTKPINKEQLLTLVSDWCGKDTSMPIGESLQASTR